MRIALLTPRFWPEVRRGTERHVHDLAVGLRALGHDPVILTAARRPGRARVGGIEVMRLPRMPEGRPGRDHLTGHLPLVGPALRALRPDVAHAFHAGDAVAAGAWGRRGHPVIYTHMGIPDADELSELARGGTMVRQAVHEARALVVLSGHAAGACMATHGREPTVIHPGVSLERFPCGRSRTPHPSVVYAGANEPRKRAGLLLDAWPLVRDRQPGTVLVADRRSGVVAAPGVEVADFDDTARLAAALGAAWAAVLPSVSEAFGLVLVEALACGTPVVATRAGGMPEVVDGPAVGRLFEGGAPELAEAIGAVFGLAADPETRRACRTRARDFEISRCAAAHVSLYSQVT